MPDHRASAALRLQVWLSPAFPVGSFSYSHGLESAVAEGLVVDAGSLEEWLSDLIGQGSAWNDAVLAAAAWRGASAGQTLDQIAELAEAMAGSRERHLETTLQGSAFGQALQPWHGEETQAIGDLPYCVAFGAAAGRHSVPLGPALAAWLLSFASALLQAAIRLSVVGQRDSVAILARLEPLILATAGRAELSSLDDLGSCTLLSDIAAMRHETQYSRLFRS